MIPQKNIAVPVKALLVDQNEIVLFTSGDLKGIRDHSVHHGNGLSLATFLGQLFSRDDYLQIRNVLKHQETSIFVQKYLVKDFPLRQITVTGVPFSANDQQPQWLLILQDVTDYCDMERRLATLKREMASIIQSHEKELEEATASLIETNVDLRREIRDRQNILEALSESETRFRDLTEATSDFIWEINAEGVYTYASPKSVKLLGLEPHQILGTPFLPWRESLIAADICSVMASDNTSINGFNNLQYNFIRQDGQEITIESSGEPIYSKRNEFAGFRGIDRDVTERRIYEIQLRQAKELAESANLAKSEFLANMSHELRTPLHAILSFANYGEKRIDTADRKELHRFFQQIITSGQRLMPLINSLLDLAKLEAGKVDYDIQQLDLMSEIKSAVNEIAPLAEKKNLKIIVHPPDISTNAYFDQGRIGQVIRNILSNGVKFSDSNTTMSITFTHNHDLHNRTILQATISNYGLGIPAKELSTIFDKFAQSSKTKTGAGGTGLGLAICKQIVEDHHGRIWASMGEDGSTRFHFTLPIKTRSEKLGQILIKKGLVTREELETALKDQ